ncbi:MAG: hypothetical protein ACYTF1_07355 [Planctomycetota bacterium]|jgi:predicted nucleic acid-binding Zn ribbon protein
MVKDTSDYGGSGIQPWMVYSTIAIVVIVGGYLVYASWTEENQPLSSPWICVTEECGNITSIVPKLGDPPPPLVCSKCDKKSLVPAYRCPKCTSIFTLNFWRGLPGKTKCPQCNIEIQFDE